MLDRLSPPDEPPASEERLAPHVRVSAKAKNFEDTRWLLQAGGGVEAERGPHPDRDLRVRVWLRKDTYFVEFGLPVRVGELDRETDALASHIRRSPSTGDRRRGRRPSPPAASQNPCPESTS